MAHIYLIGVRGIPNRYGGFERLVEVLAPDLVARGHQVTVFCEQEGAEQSPGTGVPPKVEDLWHGVRRRFVAVRSRGPLGTVEYDLRSFREVPAGAIALIFGYGTGLFQRYLKQRGVRHAVNMDGIEWQRQKWGHIARLWLRFNERQAARLADELIADHPEIQAYLRTALGAKSTMIAYGVDEQAAQPDQQALPEHPLIDRYPPQSFFLVVARPEPENQIHILLDAYQRSRKRLPMVVLGNFDANAYGRELRARHTDVHFAGGVYDSKALDELRRRSALYLHGHSVGGTNPSLIEAMAAGAWVIAHDNPFNRWVLADGGRYFDSVQALTTLLDQPPDAALRSTQLAHAQARCQAEFSWRHILGQYAALVERLAAPA